MPPSLTALHGKSCSSGTSLFWLHYNMTITDFRLFLISFLAVFREHTFALYATIQVKANGSDLNVF